MGPKTKQLIITLDEIISILIEDDEKDWCKWILKSKKRIEESDFSGIELLLKAYGGMGSFNDLVIGQTLIDDQFAWKKNAMENNNQLDRLRTQAWELATSIKDEQLR